jgi:hypothetical protein
LQEVEITAREGNHLGSSLRTSRTYNLYSDIQSLSGLAYSDIIN